MNYHEAVYQGGQFSGYLFFVTKKKCIFKILEYFHFKSFASRCKGVLYIVKL